jgi:hypothetical protein
MAARSAAQRFGREIGGRSGHGAGVAAFGAHRTAQELGSGSSMAATVRQSRFGGTLP